MFNNGVASELLHENQRASPGWHQVTDIWSFVLDNHQTTDPKGSTYAATVSHESLRQASTYTVLNNLDILLQTYEMTASKPLSLKRDYIICDPDFGLKMLEMLYSSTAPYIGQDCWT